VLIPVLGVANCGVATLCAEERFEGFLRVSSSIVKKVKDIFAIKAVGDSMNKANIKNKNIEDGDYVLIDTSDKNIKDRDYVLSTIEGHANIKKFIRDKDNDQIVLISESDKNYPPIIIHEKDDFSYIVEGKVIQVIKIPK
ncbi:MAG: S24 family peptidase, partial [bacterium]